MNRSLIKRRVTAWLAVVAGLTAGAVPLRAQNGSGGWDTGSSTNSSTPAAAPQNKISADQFDTDFLREAYQAGLAQVAMGQLALQQASSPQVKEYARRWVDDFSKATDELANMVKADVPGATRPVNNTSTSVQADNAYQKEGESQPYIYLKDHPQLQREMDSYNVAGSGMGTSGGTTGTAVARSGRPRRANERPAAGVGTGSATAPGTGSGSLDSTDTATPAANAPAGNQEFANSQEQAQTHAGSILSTQLSTDYQVTADRLASLSGTEFDRQYMKAAKNTQANMTRLLETEINGGNNEDAKQWASKYLALIRNYQSPGTRSADNADKNNGW